MNNKFHYDLHMPIQTTAKILDYKENCLHKLVHISLALSRRKSPEIFNWMI